MIVLRGDEIVERGEAAEGEAEAVISLVKKTKKYLDKIEYMYIRLDNAEYLGVFRGDYAVFIRCEEMPLGAALLKAEQVLFDLLNKPKGQVVQSF
ncbi:MAG: hypothetical protein ABWK05_00390 [Pyrobaculum sp.]